MSATATPPINPKVAGECSRFIALLRRRQHVASQDVARKTLEIMRLLVSTATVKDVSALIDSIKHAGAMLMAAQPHELVIGNMARNLESHPSPPLQESVRDSPLCCRCDACWRSCARRRRTTEKAGWVEARHAGELTPGLVARVRAAIATTMMMRMRARAAARAVEAPALH